MEKNDFDNNVYRELQSFTRDKGRSFLSSPPMVSET